tara:strand:+ start:508 stop:984 length:477 start_codon:yes stop_codon:yes gene_type:complete
MPKTEAQKLARREYNKWYDQTETGKKSIKISKWKSSGLIWTTQEEIDEIYSRYLESKYCEIFKCSKEYTTNNKKCMDHEHRNGKYGPFRNVLCNSCNSKMKDNNKSGINGISWNKIYKGWRYKIEIKGKIHRKFSKNKACLIQYKEEYEKKYLYISEN